MPDESRTKILTLTNIQAKELAGRLVTVGAESYFFKSYNQAQPGQPPWRSGAEGKAYPLLGYDQSVAAYLKFFTRPTQKRLDRTAWLIGQQMHTWLPGMAAAPLVWVDTRHDHRPPAATLDFAGYLSRAVPGETWLELKNSVAANSMVLDDDFRGRCAADLLLALAVLEQEGIVHGDLSPNNVVIDVAAGPDRPALYLIDFDAFVAPAAAGIESVTVAEGGTYGTEGYCPPSLAAAAAAGDGSLAPCSDRYARDMLLLELLLVDRGMSPDDPPSLWKHEELQSRYAAWQSRGKPDLLRILAHLDPAAVFALPEDGRPASADLAARLGLPLPGKRLLRQRTRAWTPTPAVLGHPLGSARDEHWIRQAAAGQSRPTPAALRFMVPWRWSRPAAVPGYTTLWQDVKVALGCGLLLCLPFVIGLIALLLKYLSQLFDGG